MKDYEHFQKPVTAYIRTDVPLLNNDFTIAEALETILHQGIGEKIVYFYVIDEKKRLVGVIPTRRLLTTPRDTKLSEIMVANLIMLPHTATVFDACEYFVMYRRLAYPVVDENRQVLGVVDVNMFTDEILKISDQSELDDIFETIGFHISEVRNASAFRAFRFRFPWLLVTIISGTASALLAGAFAQTLAQGLIIAFFLTLVLGLGESISIQSMAITIQALGNIKPSLKWYAGAFKKEVLSSILLGISCGFLVCIIVFLWQKDIYSTIVIGLSIALIMIMACIIGLSIPSIIHALKLDPKIAAGPLTLASTDISTLYIYFTIASLIY